MPVYLEGFEPVIRPSIASLQAAVAAYRAQGGAASIFVNDDGLQLLGPADRWWRRCLQSRSSPQHSSMDRTELGHPSIIVCSGF
jgi:hypothetical protein